MELGGGFDPTELRVRAMRAEGELDSNTAEARRILLAGGNQPPRFGLLRRLVGLIRGGGD